MAQIYLFIAISFYCNIVSKMSRVNKAKYELKGIWFLNIFFAIFMNGSEESRENKRMNIIFILL